MTEMGTVLCIVPLESESPEAVHRVRFVGELDLSSAAVLKERLVSIAGSTVEADLSDLTFIDAAGLGALLAAKAKIEQAGHRLVLVGAAGRTRHLFEIVGLKDLLTDQ